MYPGLVASDTDRAGESAAAYICTVTDPFLSYAAKIQRYKHGWEFAIVARKKVSSFGILDYTPLDFEKLASRSIARLLSSSCHNHC
jgi:hypothetical protein